MRCVLPATLAAAALLLPSQAADNGKAITPPMGFRNWNQWQSHIDQAEMEAIMRAMVDRSRTVNGKPMSLLDLGYSDVGLDDYWQECGSYGPNKWTYHDANGNPVVNQTRFPSMKAMTDFGHSLGLTVGWYGNNCGCADHCDEDICYQGDVNALVGYGYDSVKYDGCGKEGDLGLFYSLINATGKSILIENCHWGYTLPNATWCPWNYYRSSTDARPTYGSVLLNLNTIPALAAANLSTPGCWAYPDMLEVGVDAQTTAELPALNDAEMRTNFGAWAITSSPLIIGLNVTNSSAMDRAWPIISNTEAIAVNQQYAGFSGTIFKNAASNVTFYNCSWLSENDVCQWPAWQQLYKPLPGGRTAVLLMNNAPTAATLTLNFADIPGWTTPANSPVAVRDVWRQANVGSFRGKYVAAGVASHDSVFIVLSAVTEGDEVEEEGTAVVA